ncbi:MAG: YggT family protein [Gemmatimonadales bacterium]
MELLLTLVNVVFYLLYAAIIIDVLLSWLPGARDTSAGAAVHRVTGVILEPIRRVVPPAGPLDLSPFVAILLLVLLRGIVTQLLFALP